MSKPSWMSSLSIGTPYSKIEQCLAKLFDLIPAATEASFHTVHLGLDRTSQIEKNKFQVIVNMNIHTHKNNYDKLRTLKTKMHFRSERTKIITDFPDYHNGRGQMLRQVSVLIFHCVLER